MRVFVPALVLLAFLVPAKAQQQPSEIQALSQKLIEEISSDVKWRSQALKYEEQIKALQAQLDALKPKEPPKAQ